MKKYIVANSFYASAKDRLYDAVESGMADMVLNELLAYISEADAQDICKTLELDTLDTER